MVDVGWVCYGGCGVGVVMWDGCVKMAVGGCVMVDGSVVVGVGWMCYLRWM